MSKIVIFGIGRGAMSDSERSNGSLEGTCGASTCANRNDDALLIKSGNASDFSKPLIVGSKVSATAGWPSSRPSISSGPCGVPRTTLAQPGTLPTAGVSA